MTPRDTCPGPAFAPEAGRGRVPADAPRETSEVEGWRILGPGGGGCVHCLAVNPLRPETMLLSCDMTNGFITRDEGRSWREFNLKSRIYSYAFDPNDADVIYAGSSGLFRSEDHGRTWTLLFPAPEALRGEKRLGDEANHFFISDDNWPGGPVTAIRPHPRYGDTLYICVKKVGLRFLGGELKAEEAAAAQAGTLLYASRDSGRTWGRTACLEGVEILFFHIDPDLPRRAHVFTERGLFRLDLEDRSLSAIGLPAAEIRGASCGFDPDTGKTVVFLSGVSERAGVWVSDDWGATWRGELSGLTPGTESPSRRAQGGARRRPSFSGISACARDARTAYLIVERFPAGDGKSEYGIMKSVDLGRTWDWVVRMDDLHDPVNREPGWAERDYGGRWGDVPLGGDEHTQITPKGRFAWDVLASPDDPEVCYTADFSTVYRTGDGGLSWSQLVTRLHADGSASSRGLDLLGVYGIFHDPFEARHIAAAHADVGVFHSFDGGSTWHHALAGVPRAWINSCYWMLFDPKVPGRAWSLWSGLHVVPRMLNFVNGQCGGKFEGGVCSSNDSGLGWSVSSQGIPARATPTHIVMDPDSSPGRRTLYTAVFEHGVYKSIDDGRTWEPKNKGLAAENPYAWRLCLLPDGRLFLVVVAGHIPGHEVAGALYESGDNAETWHRVALPALVTDPNDLTFDPLDPDRLYLSCWPHVVDGEELGGGLYASDDGGASWRTLLDPSLHVFSATVDEANPATVYAATFDAAAYRSDDRGATWRRLSGYDFCWGHRVVPDRHDPGSVYICTYGSSIWHGPAIPESVTGE